MSSFIFSDCPSTVSLAPGEQGGMTLSVGSLSLTVRNVTTRSLIGTLSVQPEDMARSGWFKIAGAAATSPAKREIDCEAGASQTVNVDLVVPDGAPAGRKVFLLRIATERDPDNDFTDSPAVAFEVEASAPKVASKKPFPWWIVATAASAVLVVGAAIWFLLPSRMPSGLVGAQLEDAIERLVKRNPDVSIKISRIYNQSDKQNLAVVAVIPAEGQVVGKGDTVLVVYNYDWKRPMAPGRCERFAEPIQMKCLMFWRTERDRLDWSDFIPNAGDHPGH